MKRIPITIRVSPACADWLRDKALQFDCSMGQMFEKMVELWREQERKAYGVVEDDTPYIEAFVSEMDKAIARMKEEMKVVNVEDAEALFQEALRIRKDGV